MNTSSSAFIFKSVDCIERISNMSNLLPRDDLCIQSRLSMNVNHHEFTFIVLLIPLETHLTKFTAIEIKTELISIML